VINRAQHLQDDRLFECYLAELHGSPGDPLVAEHLADCPGCNTRLGELRQFMDELRAEADADTDATFTPERLRIQQEQIIHRLEHLGHAARIISFPGRLIGRRMAHTASRMTPRWAVAAAAAGLVVGVGVGSLFDPVPRRAPFAPVSIAPASVTPPAAAVSDPPAVSDDAAFLTELEMALSGPRNQELLLFDELTPHVQAISSQLR
jgi:anti-sigma factor RsiW